MRVRVKFEPRDCWVGAFWKRTKLYNSGGRVRVLVEAWICLLPTLPLYFTWETSELVRWSGPPGGESMGWLVRKGPFRQRRNRRAADRAYGPVRAMEKK